MKPSRFLCNVVCLSAAAATFFTISTVHSAVQSWSVENGDFLDGTNWSPGFIDVWPTGDTAEISNGGTATMSSDIAALVAINIGQNGVQTATGTMLQTGGDLVLSDGIVVGRQGTAVGSYEMTGGTLTLVNFRLGGGSQTSQGTMTVSGAGTLVFSAGTGHTSVGSPGTGMLTLSESAVWTHDGANAFLVGSDNNIANAVGGTGTLRVLSGAQLDLAGTANLSIGRSNGTGGNGTVVVDGGSITVATGQLNMASTNAGIGSPGGTATLTITSGAISASVLNMNEGTSTVNLDGGTVTLGGIVKLGNLGSGTVNFNGATIVAGSANADFIAVNGTGSGTLILNVQAGGFVLDTNGHAIGMAHSLAGAGGLTKQGGGTLTIAGANTYAGGTIVGGGSLIVAAGGLLGTGDIIVQNGGLLDFDYDFALTTGGLVLETGSEFRLDQNLTFAGLTIAGVDLEEGIYDYATLEAQYGGIFLDGGSGQIEVVPEPSSLALLGLGAGAAAWIVRRRTSVSRR